jgi:hypothetical protein
MSTKTLRKRIALVAVSALGFGLLSIAPSSAAQSDDLSLSSATSSVATDAPATTNLTLTYIAKDAADDMVVTPVLISGPALNGKWAKDLTGWNAATTSTTDVNLVLPVATSIVVDSATGVATYNADAAGRTTAVRTVSFTPEVAGTYVFRFTASGGVNNQVVTWTITATNPAVAASTAFLSTTTGSAPTADGTSLIASATSQVAARARLTVRQYALATQAAVAAAGGTRIDNKWASAVTVAITGAGSVALTDSASARYSSISSTAGTLAEQDFYIFSDGRTGTATITVSVGTTVVATKSFVFHGALASYSVVASKTHIGVGDTDTLTISGKDALGNAAALGTVNATSGTTTVATVTATDTAGVITVTGVAPGSAVITLGNAATSPTVSTTVTVNVAKTTAASVELSFDKAEYNPGEKMTVTVTALDSNGAGVADGPRNLFSAAGITSNVALQGATWTASAEVVVVAGKETFTAFAPLVPGPVVISATQGAAVDAVAAGGTGAVVTAATTILTDGVAQAAADAAAEATDAANAATDAANAAAEAADAATAAAQDAADAVAALSTQVAEMIDALKKQITALTNLVIKIQKKVKA